MDHHFKTKAHAPAISLRAFFNHAAARFYPVVEQLIAAGEPQLPDPTQILDPALVQSGV
jgi:hypothetical protein